MRRVLSDAEREAVFCYNGAMNRDDIIARLRENEAALCARGDDRPDSDTDIMIEIDPTARVGVYEYVGLKENVASLFDGPVDVVNREGLKPYVRPAATAEAFYVF
jgi:uncharacterized protein